MPATALSKLLSFMPMRISLHCWNLKGIYIPVLLFSFLNFPNISSACICMGTTHANENIKTHAVVFIGVLTKIQKTDSLFTTQGSSGGKEYFNFKVLRCYKGLGKYCDYISVFDYPNSSCSGFLNLAREGDTILVFAHYLGDPYSYQFLSGSQCDRYAFISKVDTSTRQLGYERLEYMLLNDSDQSLIRDSTGWHTPLNSAVNVLPAKDLPEGHSIKISTMQILITISVLINLLLLFALVKSYKRL